MFRHNKYKTYRCIYMFNEKQRCFSTKCRDKFSNIILSDMCEQHSNSRQCDFKYIIGVLHCKNVTRNNVK